MVEDGLSLAQAEIRRLQEANQAAEERLAKFVADLEGKLVGVVSVV